MPSTLVVPLLIVVEPVNLHWPPGVGQRAAVVWAKALLESTGKGCGEAWSRGWRQPGAEGFSAQLLLAAVGPFGCLHGRLPARLWSLLWSPPFPLLWLLGFIVQAQEAQPLREGRAVLPSLSWFCHRNLGAPASATVSVKLLPCHKSPPQALPLYL